MIGEEYVNIRTPCNVRYVNELGLFTWLFLWYFFFTWKDYFNARLPKGVVTTPLKDHFPAR